MHIKNINKLFGGTIITIAAVFIIIILFSQNRPSEDMNDARTADVYFLNAGTNELVSEKRALPEGEYAEEVGAVYDMLRAGPVTPGLNGVYPDTETLPSSITIVRTENTNIRNIDVNFTNAYYDLPPAEEIVLRSAIVWTLTQLDWVNEVMIKVDGVELLRSDGNPIGYMNQGNVFINANTPITQDKVITKLVVLYFADNSLTGLTEERRLIKVPSDTNEEKVILEELLKGPERNGLTATIPQDTIINEVSNQDGVCYVDLNRSFDSKLTPGTNERALAVYSIVNTLTGLSSGNVKTVQFYIDAEKPSAKNIEIDLSQPFEADPSYKISGQEEF